MLSWTVGRWTTQRPMVTRGPWLLWAGLCAPTHGVSREGPATGVRSTPPRPAVPRAEAHGTVWKPGADPGSYDVSMEKRCPVGPGMEPAAGFRWGAVCFSTRHSGPRRRTPNLRRWRPGLTASPWFLSRRCASRWWTVGYLRARLGIVANQEDDCGSPARGWASRGQENACAPSPGTNTVRNSASCSAENGDRDTLAFGSLFIPSAAAPS